MLFTIKNLFLYLGRLVIATSQKEPSVLEDDQGDTDDSLPMDSLNGACQFDRAEPSPFSARKSMYEQEDLSSLSDKSESKHTSEEVSVLSYLG